MKNMLAADIEPCTRGDVACELQKLIEKLENAEHQPECYPRRIYPECPPSHPPDPIITPHPIITNLSVLNRPRALHKNVKVTVDGRLAELYEPKEYYFDEPPLRLPPWVRPRIQSVELRGGFYRDCQCWKRDGLSDSCQRWDCGRPECLTKPMPECPPGFDPPIFGVRKGNAIIPPIIPKTRPAFPPPPYPANPEDPTRNPPLPNPPHIACPLHHHYMPTCNP